MAETECLVFRLGKTVLVGLACSAALLAAGCGTLDQGPGESLGEGIGETELRSGQDPLGPGGRASDEKGFFPLDMGNMWTYTGELVLVIDDGPPFVTETREVRSIVGTEERFGREYVIEKQFNIDEDGDTLSPSWYRYRQDRAGLYLADIAANEPPLGRFARGAYPGRVRDSRLERMARIWSRISVRVSAEDRRAYNRAWENLCLKLRAIESVTGTDSRFAALSKGPPGGVLPEEITMLKYPLHPSQEWAIRDDPFYVGAAVETHVVLDLPPGRIGGYRIRIDNSLFGPNDRALGWYGRDGFLGSEIHVESEILDPNGNPLGTMVLDDELFLGTLDLVGKGRW